VKHDKDANIFIKNLNPETTWEELNEICQKYGVVVSCKIDKYEDRVGRGIAYVQMGFKAQAEAVITALNGTEIKGKTLEVSIHVPQSERVKSNEGFTNLFV